MPSDARPKLTDAHAMTILIVGTLPPGDIGTELSALLEDVSRAVYARFPTFSPAQPPVTIHVARLADVRETH
jgi:hypothetical protein